MSRWRAQIARITLFPSPEVVAHLPDAAKLYTLVWCEEPDGFQKHAQASLPFSPSVAQGTRNGVTMSCSAHPVRVDFTLQAEAPTEPITDTLPTIPDPQNLRELLQVIVRAISDSKISPSPRRVACFLQFICEADSFNSANASLVAVLPPSYKVHLDNEEDFALQVNRARESATVKQQRMNFITKWSVERIQVLTFMTTGPLAITAPANLSPVKELLVPTVPFDNNNALSAAALTNREQSLLLQEAIDAISKEQREMLGVGGS